MSRLLYALAASMLTYPLQSAPAPEPFVSGWSRAVDPNRDCKVRFDGGAMTIEMPGTDHMYDPLLWRVNAPRIMRSLEGDFEMQVRIWIDRGRSAQSNVKGQPSFVSAGFLLIMPDHFFADCIRLEYRVSELELGEEVSVVQMDRNKAGRQVNWVRDKRRPDWPFNSKPDRVYLRLERKGPVLGHYISRDGSTWTTVGGGAFVGLPPRIKVGLAAFSTSTEPSKVQFDQLWLARGKRNKK